MARPWSRSGLPFFPSGRGVEEEVVSPRSGLTASYSKPHKEKVPVRPDGQTTDLVRPRSWSDQGLDHWPGLANSRFLPDQIPVNERLPDGVDASMAEEDRAAFEKLSSLGKGVPATDRGPLRHEG